MAKNFSFTSEGMDEFSSTPNAHYTPNQPKYEVQFLLPLLAGGILDKVTNTSAYTGEALAIKVLEEGGPFYSQGSNVKEQIEKQLRLGKPKDKESKRTPEFTDSTQSFTINSLDFAFREELQRLDFNLVVYRSVETPDVLQHFLDAGTWVDKGYVTTSLNPLIVESLDKKRLPLFEMLIPAGSSVLTLPCKVNDYCHETEITLPRNCKFTIHGYNEKRNIYKVLVEQINAWREKGKENWY